MTPPISYCRPGLPSGWIVPSLPREASTYQSAPVGLAAIAVGTAFWFGVRKRVRAPAGVIRPIQPTPARRVCSSST
jgi:hypothetical protein